MKRVFLTLFVAFATLYANAQDVIFTSDYDSIVAKVISVGASEITYQKWVNLQGPIYSMPINKIVAIRYANGTHDTFTDRNFIDNSSKVTFPNIFPLTRSGNTYFFEDNAMNKREMLKWLETQNCPAAYEHFQTGYRVSNLGWGFMLTGVTFDLLGTIIAFAAHNQQLGYIFIGMGGTLEICCIPTLIVGYCKMHNTVDMYNYSCSKTAEVIPYWSLQASANGLGIAYNF